MSKPPKDWNSVPYGNPRSETLNARSSPEVARISSVMNSQPCHMSARFHASHQRRMTLAEFVVVVEGLKHFGSLAANFCTHTAYPAVTLGTAHHEICARLAYIARIEKHSDVDRVGALASHLQAVGDRLED